jgi:hypothetical protein
VHNKIIYICLSWCHFNFVILFKTCFGRSLTIIRRYSTQTVSWKDWPHQTNYRTPYRTTTLSFAINYGWPGSIRSPDDGQGTPETCRDVLNKIIKLKWHQVGHIYYCSIEIYVLPCCLAVVTSYSWSWSLVWLAHRWAVLLYGLIFLFQWPA